MVKTAIVLASMLGSYAFAGITALNGNPRVEAQVDECRKYSTPPMEQQPGYYSTAVQMQQMWQVQGQAEVPTELQPHYVVPAPNPSAMPPEAYPGQSGYGYQPPAPDNAQGEREIFP